MKHKPKHMLSSRAGQCPQVTISERHRPRWFPQYQNAKGEVRAEDSESEGFTPLIVGRQRVSCGCALET